MNMGVQVYLQESCDFTSFEYIPEEVSLGSLGHMIVLFLISFLSFSLAVLGFELKACSCLAGTV
jgi:hypothetical protein